MTESDDISSLEGKIGFCFTDREMLTRALTHRSHVQDGEDTSNERLEFLGDSVLGTVVSEYLFEHYRGWSEGHLTRAKAAVVSEPTLAVAAKRLGIGGSLLLSKGEDQGGGRERSSILCGAFEALVAGVYLDAGMDVARQKILEWLAEPLKGIGEGNYNKDYKTLLQEVLQEIHHTLPVYRVVEERGPDHDKTFVIEVGLGRDILGVGAGKSKKEAEQAAAKHALEKRGKVEAEDN